jgi:putative ABC transport system permease protein
MSDVRFVIRSLRRQPILTIVSVFCFAIGIGASTATFSIADRLLLRDTPHVLESDRVGRLYATRTSPQGREKTSGVFTFGDYARLSGSTRSITQWAAYMAMPLTVGQGADAIEVPGALVSETFFPLLGVRPFVGRFFGAISNGAVSAREVVLSYGFWRRHLGSARGAVGSTLLIDAEPYVIVGIAPRDFQGIDPAAVELWVPAASKAPALFGTGWMLDDHSYGIRLVGRLAEGSDVGAAAAEAEGVYQRGRRAAGETGRPTRISLGSLLVERGPEGSLTGRVAQWLAVLAGILVIIGASNVGILQLARTVRRMDELAIRLALGCSRLRLVGLVAMEILALSALGVAAGLLAARGMSVALADLLGIGANRAGGALVDTRVLVFAALIGVAAALSCAVSPLIQLRRVSTSRFLRGGHGTHATRRLLGAGFVAVQVCLTCVLLTGAGVLIRNLNHVLGLNLGLTTQGIVVARVDLMRAGYSRAEADRLMHELADRLRRIVGVEEVAISVGIPFRTAHGAWAYVPCLPSLPELESGTPYYNAISPEYFTTLRTRLLEGRLFQTTDNATAPRVVIVGATMAQLVWPGHSPLGQCMQLGDATAPCAEVVGVVEDIRRWSVLEESPTMQYYVPFDQNPFDYKDRAVFVRGRGDAAVLIGPIRRTIASVAPRLTSVQSLLLEDVIEPQRRPLRLGAGVFSAAGMLALILGGAGLAGVVACLVAQRARELGIRLALGARAIDVQRHVVGRAFQAVLIGAAGGVVAAATLLWSVRDRLTIAGSVDVPVFVWSLLILLVACGVAAYLPSRRIARLDPNVVLRSE